MIKFVSSTTPNFTIKRFKKRFFIFIQECRYSCVMSNLLSWRKIKLGFNYIKFAKEIIKNSKVKLFMVDDNFQLAKFIKKNMYGKKL